MEIISIEAGTFARMLERLEDAARMTADIRKKYHEKKMGEWMDNQEACLLLDVTPRTLQTFRDNGTLAYTQVSHKIYYRPEDIRAMLAVIQGRKEGRA